MVKLIEDLMDFIALLCICGLVAYGMRSCGGKDLPHWRSDTLECGECHSVVERSIIEVGEPDDGR